MLCFSQRQIGVGNADLAKAKLFAPVFDICGQGLQVSGLPVRGCGEWMRHGAEYYT